MRIVEIGVLVPALLVITLTPRFRAERCDIIVKFFDLQLERK